MPASKIKYPIELRAEIIRMRVEEGTRPKDIAKLKGISSKVVHRIIYQDSPSLSTKVYRAAREGRWDFSEMNIEVRD